MSRSEILLLGIDLGTSNITVRSNQGFAHTQPAIVGYPKDMIGLRLVGKGQVFGEEAVLHRDALACYFPLENGLVPEGNFNNYNVVFELLQDVIRKACRDAEYDSVCGVIGVPVRAAQQNKEFLHRIAADLLDVALIVSEPFMVAYEVNELSNSIIIDIGAGTVDISAMKGMVPKAADQITLMKAGNYIDQCLFNLLTERHPELQTTAKQLKRVKEEHGFVGQFGGDVVVTMREDGRPVEIDVSEELRIACESILPDILENLVNMVQGFDPQVQHLVLENIYISGGGSSIAGIDELIALHLVEYGDVHVRCVDETGYVGASGALKLATDLPPDVWSQVGFSNSEKNLNVLFPQRDDE